MVEGPRAEGPYRSQAVMGKPSPLTSLDSGVCSAIVTRTVGRFVSARDWLT